MIPLCLVTGFLGSGKTTLLERLWRLYAGRPVAFVINEFSSFAVDHLRFPDASPDSMICIPGGSIFCRCLVTEFIETLGGIANRQRMADPPIEGVVVEASGMANPRIVGDLLRETRLDRQFSLASVVSLVDPGSFHKLLETLPVMRDQIEASNVALINKIDLHDQTALAAVETKLREIQPNLIVQRVKYADARLDLFAPFGGLEDTHGSSAECRDPQFTSYAVITDAEYDLDQVQSLLSESESFLYRAKGMLNSSEGPVFVDYSTGSMTVRPALKAFGTNGLVLIGSDEAKIKDLARRMRLEQSGGSAV